MAISNGKTTSSLYYMYNGPLTISNISLEIEVSTSPWMGELGFYVPSTLFQSFRDDGRVNMKGSVQ